MRRFVELARDGGWLAVVVPEGIVASDRSQALREWVLERASLRAVVALPDRTFAGAGTTARTALLLARKGHDRERDILLASPDAGCRGRGKLEAYLNDVLAILAGQVRDVPSGHRRRV